MTSLSMTEILGSWLRLRFKSHVRILSWRFSKYPDDNAPAGHPGRWLLGFNSFYVA